MKTKQFNSSSTQQFTEIVDIIDTVIIFENNSASCIIEVASTNFTLLSGEEQDAKVSGYAAFLNSLAFPIQILIVNKRIDISAYVTMLEKEIPGKTNQLEKEYMTHYRDFIQQLVKQKIVLDKKFYIIVPESALEIGVQTTIAKAEDFATTVKPALQTKVTSLLNQLRRIGLQAKLLDRDDIVKLFHSMYHQEDQQTEEQPK